MSWRERESMIEMEDPDGNDRRPDSEMSEDPKLLRDGGPGSIVDNTVSDFGTDIVKRCRFGFHPSTAAVFVHYLKCSK